jgi:hypothetical protein
LPSANLNRVAAAGVVREQEIAALLGLSEADTRALLLGARHADRRGSRAYRWKDIAKFLQPECLSAVRAAARGSVPSIGATYGEVPLRPVLR